MYSGNTGTSLAGISLAETLVLLQAAVSSSDSNIVERFESAAVFLPREIGFTYILGCEIWNCCS